MVEVIVEELEKLSPEERLKRLEELKLQLRKEKEKQILAAEELIKKTNEEIHRQEDEDIKKMMDDIEESDTLEETVKGEEPEASEHPTMYDTPKDLVDEKLQKIQDGYQRSNTDSKYENKEAQKIYKSGSGVKAASDKNWDDLGYKKK
ncbi:hypothetical protein KY330_06095 [Candidatus Woesearchaeota archaeon]|nr:hypothetical protein [Candidatus Woesearchaeota archaeon]